MPATYAQRLAQERQTYLSIGEEFGQQRVIDAICLALRDKDVMGKNTFGVERIKKLCAKIQEIVDAFSPAFHSGAEQDYYQVQLDRALQEVFGDELQPFETRYPFIKEQKYGRRK